MKVPSLYVPPASSRHSAKVRQTSAIFGQTQTRTNKKAERKQRKRNGNKKKKRDEGEEPHTNSDDLEVICLSPINEPVSKRGNGRLVSLVHKGYVTLASRTSRRKLGLAGGGGLVVPVARVDVVVDDGVVHLTHDGEELAARLEVGGAHVGGLAAEDVDHGLLDLLHLALDRGRAHRAHVRVCPVREGKEMLAIRFSFGFILSLVLLLWSLFSLLILRYFLFPTRVRKVCLPCVASNLV